MSHFRPWALTRRQLSQISIWSNNNNTVLLSIKIFRQSEFIFYLTRFVLNNSIVNDNQDSTFKARGNQEHHR
jgi:hypothetical protein